MSEAKKISPGLSLNAPDVSSNQKIFIIPIRRYIWFVPYVEKPKGKIFLKTAFPNRKYNKCFGGTEYGK